MDKCDLDIEPTIEPMELLGQEVQQKIVQMWIENKGILDKMQTTRYRLRLQRSIPWKVGICKELGRFILQRLRLVRGACRELLDAIDTVVEKEWRLEKESGVKIVLWNILMHYRRHVEEEQEE